MADPTLFQEILCLLSAEAPPFVGVTVFIPMSAFSARFYFKSLDVISEGGSVEGWKVVRGLSKIGILSSMIGFLSYGISVTEVVLFWSNLSIAACIVIWSFSIFAILFLNQDF